MGDGAHALGGPGSLETRSIDDGATWTDEVERGPSTDEASVSHGRYRLGELLGRGGFGQVHRGTDTLTGDEVAIKFVTALSVRDLERTRRELAALRWLRLPGVVRLRDDGAHGPAWFMVMDLVAGRPLGAEPWERFEPLLLQLLEVLARVHLAGVLHLDLKPSNVFVTPEGRVVVLDFGIARGRALPDAPQRLEGTPRYMPPEQMGLGGTCDERSDLYAVGVMVEELCPDLPPHAAVVVASMRHPDPDHRPDDALAAYVALTGRSPLPLDEDRSEPWTHEELCDLFGGADRFTHLAEDAADLVWSRTGGDARRVVQAVRTAVLAGVVTWDGDQLVVDRSGFERWSGHVPARLLSMDGEGLTDDVVIAARDLRLRGRLAAAAALVEAALAAGSARERAQELALLEERVLTAIMLQTPLEVDLALYSLERTAPGPEVDHLTALVRRFRATLRGERDLAAATPIDPFDHPELEIRRQACLVSNAGQLGPDEERAALDALSAWAEGDDERRAVLAGWWGRHWYNRGDYRRAAEAHERASASKTASIGRLSSTVAAAAAWAEVPDLARAEALACRAEQDARELRHARYEAYAVWMLRNIAYRSQSALPPDEEMLRAVAGRGADLEAPFAATDAAAAYRLGETDRCEVLAEHAARRFAQIGFAPGALLMEALAAWVAGRPLELLAEEARGCPVSDVELQVLALARWSSTHPPADWRDRQLRLAEARDRTTWDVRLDVWSVTECLAEAPPEVGRG
ncbi:MAG: serine/threonine protein kinase [Alphaproteobacteria bacterium]|nr:serine/threonine protein kinase [Alphaproteobacteria bacterium]